jgi:anaerobic selenocysteine-containing dehydrogenase
MTPRDLSLPLLGETICPYCGVGCRLHAEGEPGPTLRVRGVADAPANRGRLCAKGALLGETIDTHDRLLRPLMRTSRHAPFRSCDWSAALRQIAARFQEIRRAHGPDAVAFYGSGQLDTEASYLACKLFKGSLHTNNTDSNSRLCMASAVAGYKSSLGSDGPPCCYEDIEIADIVFLVGSNLAEAHPVLFDRLRSAKQSRPGTTIIVADPRRTATARIADFYLPVRPGADVALLNALGRMLLDRSALDEEFIHRHTTGVEAYKEFLLSQDLDNLCTTAGVERGPLEAVAGRIAEARGVLSLYCMGLNQSAAGTWKNNSLINLHLLTGQIGKPGAGPFSLTGQPNAMGRASPPSRWSAPWSAAA